jgi:anti-anti-sigma regulatory factor
MLRVEFNDDGNGALLVRMFGRMVGLYAADARNALTNRQLPASIVVDLSEVTFVDLFGEQVLLWLGRLGARFVANNVYVRSVCERLQLHISEKPTVVDSETDTSMLP